VSPGHGGQSRPAHLSLDVQIVVHPPGLSHLIGDLDEARANVYTDDLGEPAGRRRELERAASNGAPEVKGSRQRESRAPRPGGQQLGRAAGSLERCLDQPALLQQRLGVDLRDADGL